ncbi:MAG: isoprenyl transferase [Thermoguttaceae bacterium]
MLRHLAIIMDGNGRWAQSRGLPRGEGHRVGSDTSRTIIEECVNLGIEYLTLYCLSSENWKRPAAELDALMKLLQFYLALELPRLQAKNIRLRIIGRRTGLPTEVLAVIDESVRVTASNTGMTLCLAINYGGRGELVDAASAIARDVVAGKLSADAITEETIASHLYTAGMPDPDLLIRTGGDMRVSNYLLWQVSYAEFWSTPTFWPDFTPALLHEAINDFNHRVRRFGGIEVI